MTSPLDSLDDDLRRHAALHGKAARVPLVGGARVTLLPGGAETLDAIVEAIEQAREWLHLEYYEFQDVHWRGCRVVDLLVEKCRQGVRLVVSYDAAGSQDVDDAVFETLRRAGALLLEFRPFNPFRRRFNPFTLNDRDHRKILLADGEIAIIGGVNLSRVYENPRSAGAPPDPMKGFWYDAAARIEGPPVAEIARIFRANWRHQGGAPIGPEHGPEHGHEHGNEPAPTPAPAGDETVRIDGSAPRQHRQLYFESLKAATAAAASHIILATGYFVPSHGQFRLFKEAAERGVQVDLILAGYSDIPACTHAARALYGRLLQRGVRIHELNDGMLHAKVATIDGVWTAIGSSNLDRRSFLFNNEIDAIVFGRTTASAVEAMLRDWIAHADRVSLETWRHRPVKERLGELLARGWSRYM